MERTTSVDAIPFTVAYRVLESPRSPTSQAAKYSVAMFIENTVFAKSYSAQLKRSRAGAIAGFNSPLFIFEESVNTLNTAASASISTLGSRYALTLHSHR